MISVFKFTYLGLIPFFLSSLSLAQGTAAFNRDPLDVGVLEGLARLPKTGNLDKNARPLRVTEGPAESKASNSKGKAAPAVCSDAGFERELDRIPLVQFRELGNREEEVTIESFKLMSDRKYQGADSRRWWRAEMSSGSSVLFIETEGRQENISVPSEFQVELGALMSGRRQATELGFIFGFLPEGWKLEENFQRQNQASFESDTGYFVIFNLKPEYHAIRLQAKDDPTRTGLFHVPVLMKSGTFISDLNLHPIARVKVPVQATSGFNLKWKWLQDSYWTEGFETDWVSARYPMVIHGRFEKSGGKASGATLDFITEQVIEEGFAQSVYGVPPPIHWLRARQLDGGLSSGSAMAYVALTDQNEITGARFEFQSFDRRPVFLPETYFIEGGKNVVVEDDLSSAPKLAMGAQLSPGVTRFATLDNKSNCVVSGPRMIFPTVPSAVTLIAE